MKSRGQAMELAGLGRLQTAAGDLWRSVLPLAQLYPPQIEIFAQGAPASETYLIETGLVKLVRADSQGDELLVGLRAPNWFLGIAPVLARSRYPVTAITLTRCGLRRVPLELFLHLTETRADLRHDVQQKLSREWLDQVERLTQLSYRSSRQRIEKTLLEWAEAVDGNDRDSEWIKFSLPLKHLELAALLAVTPQHLSRVFKRLREGKAVEWGNGVLAVHALKLRSLLRAPLGG